MSKFFCVLLYLEFTKHFRRLIHCLIYSAGASPFAAGLSALPFGHLAHLPGAFSMLGHPAFPVTSLFGRLGDGLTHPLVSPSSLSNSLSSSAGQSGKEAPKNKKKNNKKNEEKKIYMCRTYYHEVPRTMKSRVLMSWNFGWRHHFLCYMPRTKVDTPLHNQVLLKHCSQNLCIKMVFFFHTEWWLLVRGVTRETLVFASNFNCMPVGRTLHKTITQNWFRSNLFMYVVWSTRVHDNWYP